MFRMDLSKIGLQVKQPTSLSTSASYPLYSRHINLSCDISKTVMPLTIALIVKFL